MKFKPLLYLNFFVAVLVLSGSRVTYAVVSADVDKPTIGTTRMMLNENKDLQVQERQVIRAELKDKIQEGKEEFKSEKCDILEDRVTKRLNLYSQREESRTKRFESVNERIKSVIAKAKEAGLDTTLLETHLSELNVLVLNVTEARKAFITNLDESKEFACGASSGEFKNRMTTAKKSLDSLKKAVEEASTYYKTVLRLDIVDLLDQVRSNTNE